MYRHMSSIVLRGGVLRGANLSADLFNAAVEKIISTARPRGGIRIGAPLDDPSMAQLDELLVPPAGATLPSTSEMEQESYDLFK